MAKKQKNIKGKAKSFGKSIACSLLATAVVAGGGIIFSGCDTSNVADVWIVEAGAPKDSDGQTGQLYFDSTTCDLYKKNANGKWEIIANLKGDTGATGAQGEKGEKGDTGATGAQGERGEKGENGEKGDTGAQGPQGQPGQTGQQGPQGEKGNGIENIDISYSYDNDGNAFAIVTITYTDKSLPPKVIVVPIPERVVGIHLLNNYYTMINDGNEPTMLLDVTYESGKTGTVQVTKDMITGELDFTTAGTYDISITYQGKKIFETITVIDPNDVSVSYISCQQSSVVFLFDASSNQPIENLSNYTLTINKNDNSYINTTLADAEVSIDYSAFTEIGKEFTAVVSYGGQTTQLFVLPVSDLSSLTLENATYRGSYNIVCEINSSEIFEEDDVIEYTYNYNKTYYTNIQKATLSMVNGLDVSVESKDNYSFNNGINGSVDILVYNPETTVLENVYFSREILVGTDINDIEVSLSFVTANKNYFYKTIYCDQSMITGDYDLNNIGVYNVTLTYQGTSRPATLRVYDPNVCNINYIALSDMFDLKINVGDDVEQYIQENIVGKEITVFYYQDVNGSNSDRFPITRDMIDFSSVNTNTVGSYYFTISYTLDGQTVGVSTECNINVEVDMSSATLLNTYTFDSEIQETFNWKSLKTYDNGIAYIYSNDTDYTLIEYTIDGTILSINQSSIGAYCFYSINNDNLELSNYIPESNVDATYTMIMTDDGMSMPLTINIYGTEGECYALVRMDLSIMDPSLAGQYMNMFTTKCIYSQDKTQITALGKTYNINADNSLTEAE